VGRDISADVVLRVTDDGVGMDRSPPSLPCPRPSRSWSWSRCATTRAAPRRRCSPRTPEGLGLRLAEETSMLRQPRRW